MSDGEPSDGSNQAALTSFVFEQRRFEQARTEPNSPPSCQSCKSCRKSCS